MQLDSEGLERKVLLLERQIKQLVEAGRERTLVDRMHVTPTGSDDIALTANTLFLFPIFVTAPIHAAAVYLSARRNPAAAGTSRIWLSLYRAILDDRFTPPAKGETVWGETVGQFNNRTKWRKLEESGVVSESTTVAMRLRWTFPHDIPMVPGPGVYAIGIITDTADTYFQGVAESVHFAPIRASEPAILGGGTPTLPTTVTSLLANTSSAVSLTLYSRRGMKTLGR